MYRLVRVIECLIFIIILISTINKTCADGIKNLIHFRGVSRCLTHLRNKYPRATSDDKKFRTKSPTWKSTFTVFHLQERFDTSIAKVLYQIFKQWSGIWHTWFFRTLHLRRVHQCHLGTSIIIQHSVKYWILTCNIHFANFLSIIKWSFPVQQM